jgi:predicted enzyme related to lactoylglutathione lyase
MAEHKALHAPGMFTWVELATTDQPAAKSFYTSLFGWSAEDSPMGPGEFYTTFRKDGKDMGGEYTLRPDQRAMHIPPHWMVYVAVQNADEAVEKAKQLGGQAFTGAFDVMEYGRMAVLSDPTGAVFSIWQAKQHTGLGAIGGDGEFSWADLNTDDPKRAGEFYSKLFGWHLEKGEHDPEGGYLHIKCGEHYIGGIPPARPRQEGVPPHWLIYFHASDCDASTNKGKSLGANVMFGPMTMENVGRFSIVADPQGAVFSLFQPMRKS